MTTLLLSPSLFSQDSAEIEDESYHHLFRVKRLQTGDALRVVDGLGKARAARIDSVGKRSARLTLGESIPPNEPALAVELYVAPPKPERAAWLVEKATEIGVVAVRFISTEREARSLSPSQIGRLRRIAVSAVEQCGRSFLPDVAIDGGLRETLSRTSENGVPVVVLDAAGSVVRSTIEVIGRIALFVGPEGGWSDAERSTFEATAVPLWSLGPTVLRVETAAIVAAGALMSGS